MAIEKTVMDTGIFQLTTFSVGDDLSEFVSAMGNAVKAALNRDPLQEARDDATRILIEAGFPITERGSCDARDPVVNDAASLLGMLDHLDRLPIEKLDSGELLGRGYHIGYLHLKMMVRSFERQVRDAKQQAEARRKGGEQRAKRFQPSPEQVHAWRAEVDAKRKSNPKISRYEAMRRVAQEASTTFYQVKKALGPATAEKSVEC